MRYGLIFRHSAQRDLKGLPRDVQVKAMAAADSLCVYPTPAQSEELTGNLCGFRKVRLGHYRIVYEVDDADEMIRIWGVGHRSRIYETMRRRAK